MTEKVSRMPSLTGTNVKPVPMRLFAAWEVDRTPPNCVPRLCSLTLSRLVILKPLGLDVTSITLAVKMQSSKRTLRSNEITLPIHGLLDTELELSFALQYPHYLKQDCNKLQVMLQRRKRYKNRTIMGFKTLAIGAVNMAMALQRQMDIELELHCESKDKNTPLARVTVQSLSSQPVDHEEAVERLKSLSLGDNADRNVVDYRYDEDDEDGSDSEPLGVVDRRVARKASRSKILPPGVRVGSIMQQRNLKQKFISLLKRFKITEDLQGLEHDEAGGMDPSKLSGADLDMDAGDIEDLIDELEDLSDSGPEMDTLSVTSTPKPCLRPFFASSRSLALDPMSASSMPSSMMEKPIWEGHGYGGYGGYGLLERHYSDESSKRALTDSDSHAEVWTDQEQSDTPAGTTATVATTSTTTSTPTTVIPASSPPRPSQEDKTKPRKTLLEQLQRSMPADDAIPDHVILVNGSDCLAGCHLAAKLVERQQRVVCTAGGADVRHTIGCLVNKIQKFCNSSAKPPPPIKVVVVGSDSYVNSVLQSYVQQFSIKPPDWQNHLKFYVVPFGTGPNTVARYLASQDRFYSANFASDSWREAVDRSDGPKMATGPVMGLSLEAATVPLAPSPKLDVQEIVHRLGRYLNSNGAVLQVPIAEAIITYCEASSEEESTQVLIPFVSQVRIGIADTSPGGVDVEDGNQLTPMTMAAGACSAPCGPTSGSPPQSNSVLAATLGLGDVVRERDRDKTKDRERITPPSSPNISAMYGNPRDVCGSGASSSSTLGASGASSTPGAEPVELQVDYWLSASSAAARESTAASAASAALSTVSTALAVKKEKGESVKYTVKAGFRWIVIKRLPSCAVDAASASSLFTMTFGVKEKKQKIMRLGKKKEKEKDSEMKSEMVSGINRLVCQAKTHHSLLKVVIDGVEWNNVKFFQLSSQWQTHIRYLPVALFTDTAF